MGSPFKPWRNSIIQANIRALQSLPDSMEGQFQVAVERLTSSLTSGIAVTGMGKSGYVARKFAATLQSAGIWAFYVHPSEASHGDLGLLKKRGALVFFSDSGETNELRPIIDYARKTGMWRVGITRNQGSSLAQVCNACIAYPLDGEPGPHGLAPMASCVIQMCVGDALASALMHNIDLKPETFAEYHPGGSLGIGLAPVSSLMRPVPTVNRYELMSDVICKITDGKSGHVGVVDLHENLVGVITDGDIRRNMDNDLLSKEAMSIMTKKPAWCTGDVLAKEALRRMNEKKITALFVLEGQKTIGLIHAHDILGANL